MWSWSMSDPIIIAICCGLVTLGVVFMVIEKARELWDRNR